MLWVLTHTGSSQKFGAPSDGFNAPKTFSMAIIAVLVVLVKCY